MESVINWWKSGHPLVSRWTHNSNKGYQLTWVGHAANFYHRVTRWVRWSWWSYVLAPREKSAWGSWPVTAWCRLTGHRGTIFYNPGGLEPDNRCKGCGEEIS